ncbi:MAG: hypothetical protein ACYS3S_18535 [Planctomycetota bacterium]
MDADNLNLMKSKEVVENFQNISSDRDVAIGAGCHLEECLKEFIQLYIVGEPEKAADILLNTGNSVSTFSKQIEFARACDWITEDIKKDLDTIGHIKNKFGDSPDQQDFSEIPDDQCFRDFSQIYDSDLRKQYLNTVSMTTGQMWSKIRPLLVKKQWEEKKRNEKEASRDFYEHKETGEIFVIEHKWDGTIVGSSGPLSKPFRRREDYKITGEKNLWIRENCYKLIIM